MKRNVTKHITSNFGIKLLSLLIAFIIWLIVFNVDNPTKSALFRGVPIQVINESSVADIDKVYDIISGESVTIKVTERKSVINSLARDGSDFEVVADMEHLTEMGTVPLVVVCRNAAVTLDEVEIVPAAMKVQLEQKKQSEFLINVSVIGQPKGYEVGKTEIEQGKSVQIAGPASMIDKIGQVMATVDLGQAHSDQSLDGTLQIVDKNGDAFKENQMSRLQIMDAYGAILPDNEVTVNVSMWEVKNNIPVEVKIGGEPAEGYHVASLTTLPQNISLVGTEEALENLKGRFLLADPISVDGASENFTAELDLTQTLSQMEGIRLPADADPTISVSVQIEQTGDRNVAIPLSNLTVLNRPEKMQLAFSPADAIELIVHTEDFSKKIKPEDIEATIDLEVCSEPGIYEVPVEVKLPDEYTLVNGATLVVTADMPAQEKESETEQTED